MISATSRRLHSSNPGLRVKTHAAIDGNAQDKELMLLNISSIPQFESRRDYGILLTHAKDAHTLGYQSTAKIHSFQNCITEFSLPILTSEF